MYEEEVFSSPGALWFSPPAPSPSPTRTFLAYLRTNDSNVRTTVVEYAPLAKDSSFYPRLVEIRYPKPGTPNPVVSVWVYNVGAVLAGECGSAPLPTCNYEITLPSLSSSDFIVR